MKKLFLIGILFLNLFLPVVASEDLEAIRSYNLGIDNYNRGKINEAILNFRKAIIIDPTFQEAYYNLAQILNSENQTEEAITLYKKALNIDSKDFQSTFALAEIYYQKKQYENALSYLNKIPFDDENYPDSIELKKEINKKLLEIKLKEEEAKKEEERRQLLENQKMKGLLPLYVFNDVKNPSGIATDSLGNTYIASYSQNIIFKYDKNNQKTTVASEPDIKGPIGVQVDSENNLYVANYGLSNILKIKPDGTKSVFANIEKPYIITIFDDILYVSEQSTNTVVKYKLK